MQITIDQSKFNRSLLIAEERATLAALKAKDVVAGCEAVVYFGGANSWQHALQSQPLPDQILVRQNYKVPTHNMGLLSFGELALYNDASEHRFIWEK